MSEEDETVAGLARRWLRWAQEDLGLARSAHADPDVVPRGACTWAHQCGEKALKAIFVAQDLDPPKNQNLLVLEQLMPPGVLEALREVDLEGLTSWSIEGRYPANLEEATAVDATNAIDAAATVLMVIEGHLGRFTEAEEGS
jgi:HEPN domain-containing protein